MKRIGIILMFIVFAYNGFSQEKSMLTAIQNYELHEEEAYTLIYIKNNVDTQTYCKIVFDVPQSLLKNKKGVADILPKLLLNEANSFTSSKIKFSVAKNEISAIYNNSIDTLYKYLSNIIFSTRFKSNNYNTIKNKVTKNLFPPNISPNKYIINKTQNAFYGNNHPLGEQHELKKMKNISLQDCQKYYNEVYLNSPKYIIVMGNIDFDSLKMKTEKYFAQLKTPIKNTDKFKTPSLPKHSVIFFHETEEQIIGKNTYMNLMYPVDLQPGDKTFVASQLINNIMGRYKSGRLYSTLFVDKKIAEFIFFRYENFENNSEISISVVLKPESLAEIIKVIIAEKNKMFNEEISQIELDIAKEDYIKSFMKSINSFDFITKLLVNTHKFNLPSNYYSSFPLKIKKLSSKDIKSAVDNYLRTDKYTIVVLGKSPKLENELLELAGITETRTFVDGIQRDYIPYGFNAFDIIKMFLDEVNAEKYPTVKGQEIKLRGKYILDDIEYELERNIERSGKKYLSETYIIADSTQRIFLRKDIVNGKNIISINYGDTLALENVDRSKLLSESFQFPELEYYVNDSIIVELKGVVNNNDTILYKIFVKYPYGRAKYDYYDKKTKLKVKSEELKFVKNKYEVIRTIEIKNYKQIPGSKKKKLPNKKIITTDDFIIIIEIIEADLNKKISNKEFQVE